MEGSLGTIGFDEPGRTARSRRQHVNARADTLRHRLGFEFPVKLRDPGARSRPRFFFFASEDLPAICDRLQKRLSQQAEKILERSGRICQHRFDLLGYQDLDNGTTIDWHCYSVHGKRGRRKAFYKIRYLDCAEAGDIKIIWELNRHQHFVTLAKGVSPDWEYEVLEGAI